MTTQTRLEIPAHLNGRHERTYEAIFRHPVAHNLEWHDVRSLLEALAEVTDWANGSPQVTRNGQVITLHVPKRKDVASVEDVLALRHFLEQSGAPAAPTTPTATASDLLVVIDHQEAKVYRTVSHGAVPEHLAPDDPHGYGRHLHSQSEETGGKRKPERKSFYEAVAATLRGADRILIFGNGESSAMERLVADLKRNHAGVAEHIVGTLLIDGHHPTEDQLLARAREFFDSTETRN